MNKRKFIEGLETRGVDSKKPISFRSTSKKASKIDNPTSNDFEVSDSLCSTWLLSEPPDIRIWFPGYVYESPGVGTGDFFGVEREDDIENRDIVRKDIEIADFNGCAVPELKREELSFDEKISPRSANDYENNQYLQSIDEDILVKPTTSNNDDIKWAYGNLVKDIKKENEGRNGVDNGFISIKNNINAVKSVHSMGKQKAVKLHGPLFSAGLYSVEKRKILSDVTNSGYSSGHGIPGKWLCPRNRKLKPGPALKQLGLEKWVRRL